MGIFYFKIIGCVFNLSIKILRFYLRKSRLIFNFKLKPYNCFKRENGLKPVPIDDNLSLFINLVCHSVGIKAKFL